MKWSTLAEKTHQELKRRSLLQKREHLLVAFSGGLDSTVLLHVLLELRPYWKWELSAGHVDHGLRPGYDEKEAVFCRELAEKHGIPYYEKKLHLNAPEFRETYAPVGSQAPGPEALAREARYRVLGTWAEAIRADAVVTAHHAGDQAETVLYRMLTGAGLRGLGGIPAKRQIFRRPFLQVMRTELEAYADTHDLKHCEDLSNRDETIVRNRIRHRVIPQIRESGFERAERDLARSAEDLREADAALAFFEARYAGKFLYVTGRGVHLRREGFEALPVCMQKRIVRRVFEERLKETRHVSRKQLEQALHFMLYAGTGRSTELLGHRMIKERECITWPSATRERFRETLVCGNGRRAGNAQAGYIHIRVGKGTGIPEIRGAGEAYFSPRLIGRELVFRSREAGDRMSLYGASGRKKVKAILKDEKVPPAEKPFFPVLLAGNAILWIPGVKRSDKYLLGETEKHFVHIVYKHNGEVS